MKKLFLLLLVLTLLLASCTSFGPAFRRNSGFTSVDYFTGTQGLEISFLEQAPPESVYEGSPLDVQVLVKNKGAFDIVDNYTATFYVTFDSLEMLKQTGNFQTSEEPEFAQLEIHGKSPAYPQGETRYLFSEDNPLYKPSSSRPSLSFNAKPIVANFEKNSATFYVTACYPYKTFFSDEVCIDTDPQHIDPRKKVCRAEDKKYPRGQGAPVAITAVETNMVPKGTYVLPQFVIHIAQEGDGIVSDFTVMNRQCGPLTKDTVNTLHIESRLGNDRLSCYPKIIHLKEGKAEAVCKLETNSISLSSSNYPASLHVDLSYQYTQTISKDIIVKRTRPLNLQEEKPLDATYCHPWEEFVAGGKDGGQCVSKCKYYADQHDTSVFEAIATKDEKNNLLAYKWPILQQGASPAERETAWQSLNCVYGDEGECRKNPSTCVIASDLCQPGSFCGWPVCFERNQQPQVESASITDSFLSWSCRDGDDNPAYDPQQTCGCDNKSYWTLVEKRTWLTLVGKNKAPTCKNLPDFKYAEHEVEGTYNPMWRTMEFRTTPPLYDYNETAICVKVVDKQGNAAYQRVVPTIYTP